MQKKILFFILLLMITFSCTKKEFNLENEDLSLAKVMVNSKLTVGVNTTHPPLAFNQPWDKKLVGFDIDVLKAVAAKMDIDIEFIPIEWKDKLKLLDNGKIDCIAGGFSQVESRNVLYEITKPYFRNAQIILVLKESNYHKIHDLKGKEIGGQKDSVGINRINNNIHLRENFTIVNTYDTVMHAINALKNKHIEAAIADIITITRVLKDNPDKFRVLEEALALGFYTYAFKKGNITLKNEIEEKLMELERDGILEAISRKWLDIDAIIIGK